MAQFVLEGQDANNTAITFTIDSGAENFFGNAGGGENLDDTVSYTDYDGNVYSGVSFDVAYEGQINWANGNKAIDPVESYHVVIITITSGDEAGQTYTLILDPIDPVEGMFGNGNHRAGPSPIRHGRQRKTRPIR